MRLAELYRYPVKSLCGHRLQRMKVDRRGPVLDRHWMVVNDRGRFLSQRELPKMALIRPRLSAETLVLSTPGGDELVLDLLGQGQPIEVQVWADRCVAQPVSAEADYWLSEFLGVNCRLVYLPEEQHRRVDPTYAEADDETGFADGFPFLLISRASLEDLNRRLPRALPMERFRPNLVVEGCAPYAEDAWRRIRIGDLTFRVAKPCARCVIPTVNPETGEREGNEPLKTLMSYRKRGSQVFFGQNLLHDGSGVLEAGMPVEVLQ